MQRLNPRRMTYKRRFEGGGVICPHRACKLCGQTLGPYHDDERCSREYQKLMDAEFRARKEGRKL